jgi:LmbE family N-acetylglucosaminyl deacetylase
VLCLGAHSDDIEIGCGGTVLRLLEETPGVEVQWVVLAAAGPRAGEAAKSADLFLAHAGKRRVITRNFKDGHFPYVGADIKDFFEELSKGFSPDLVLTHYRGDLHQDHRVVSELTWNTFRNHLILEYEIPKYDGDIGTPNFFVELTRATCQKKIQYLIDCFGTQKDKSWFTEDTFQSVLRLRGMECRAADGYAEAFYGRKMRF